MLKEDIGYSTMELTHGASVRFPGEIFEEASVKPTASAYAKDMRIFSGPCGTPSQGHQLPKTLLWIKPCFLVLVCLCVWMQSEAHCKGLTLDYFRF